MPNLGKALVSEKHGPFNWMYFLWFTKTIETNARNFETGLTVAISVTSASLL
jgi:hypothetical protein